MSRERANALRRAGLRVTEQRLAVLELLERWPHAAADEIAHKLMPRFGSISAQITYGVLAALSLTVGDDDATILHDGYLAEELARRPWLRQGADHALRVWPHSDYPLIPVGHFTLNRNPRNFFAEIEQAAFSSANLAPEPTSRRTRCS